MNIIIVGCGKVGQTLAAQLNEEGNNITVVDTDAARVNRLATQLDVMGVTGNGATHAVQSEAGVENADLLIAVTGSDELNMLCCLIAHKESRCKTIARIKKPEYGDDIRFLQEELGLAMVVNPEQAAAAEIARILRVPAAFSVESFARGTVELIGFQITEQDGMAGKSLIEYNKLHPNALLLCAAKRGGEVLVPNGHFVPQAGDRVYAIGTPTETARVLRSMGRDTSPIRQLSVIGGGRIALYLAWALDGMGMHITIVEQNEEKCMAIAEKLPKATILHGDGTDHDLLESEGIFDADAFVSLTGRDEENLLMALTAKDSGVAKVLPKMSRPNYTALVHDLGIDTVISPKDVTASQISSYVRGLANSQGSAVESLHKILGGAMEAVEFTATGATHFLNTPLKDLNFKPGLLVAAIVHGGKLLIPGGHSIISEGDRVIVVAKSLFLKDLNDILVR